MQHSINITIQHGKFEWVKTAHSFEHGITIAQNLQEKFGLIGKTYIISSCGKQTWIR